MRRLQNKRPNVRCRRNRDFQPYPIKANKRPVGARVVVGMLAAIVLAAMVLPGDLFAPAKHAVPVAMHATPLFPVPSQKALQSCVR